MVSVKYHTGYKFAIDQLEGDNQSDRIINRLENRMEEIKTAGLNDDFEIGLGDAIGEFKRTIGLLRKEGAIKAMNANYLDMVK